MKKNIFNNTFQCAIDLDIKDELAHFQNEFHFPKVNWILSDVSAAYGSAMLAALSKDRNKITVKQIIRGEYLVSF